MKTLKIPGGLMGEVSASLKTGKLADGQLTVKSGGLVRVGAAQ